MYVCVRRALVRACVRLCPSVSVSLIGICISNRLCYDGSDVLLLWCSYSKCLTHTLTILWKTTITPTTTPVERTERKSNTFSLMGLKGEKENL